MKILKKLWELTDSIKYLYCILRKNRINWQRKQQVACEVETSKSTWNFPQWRYLEEKCLDQDILRDTMQD